MANHTIQIFATTANYHPLSISQDNGATWVDTETADKAFTTNVDAGDTVTYAFGLSKGGVANNISSIQAITPGAFFEPGKKPNQNNGWTGTIKSGITGTEEYIIRYQVTNVTGIQDQDPKLKMN
ncbi:hypothetical protein SAMN04488008_10728 [Maribacter orientalis]|uniref:Uncharacterized protein n=1 Tax=Maribacter orientalis TaxID=228957 RepID=A0A1H7U6R9_9FLAO|nr:hypothetical protein [Maribacter orientalis]SEL92740.1 hypothetical protein SAMN04488008_10728 [Maribacter orientalis]